MYSSVGLLKNAKKSGRLIGTHQKLDRVARRKLGTLLRKKDFFPSIEMILNFEGNRGPDGLKTKSPGVDEPMHMILPDDDDGVLRELIQNHLYNLRQALLGDNRSYEGIYQGKKQSKTLKKSTKPDVSRAAFEAAWLAHSVVDGLTPPHHFPYQEAVNELMSDQEYVKIFGQPVKGIMPGHNFSEKARNNWLYLGPEGYMTKHIAFEYGAALLARSMSYRSLTPKITLAELKKLDPIDEFYKTLHKINERDIYTRFRRYGWTRDLANECRHLLLPEMVRMIIIAWFAAIPREKNYAKKR
ncbi:MAG: hypothetical protein Q4F60_00270 [Candidatus Saccharibacteria bacterium]|nr:hypothetical protein [Candidatus Saccharibacteria bacterium]